jgi:hypothetical protein
MSPLGSPRADARGWLFWTPRVVTLAFAGFLSLFALDVFQPGLGAARVLVEFAVHMVPTVIVLVLLAIAWRWEWVGAVAYFGLGVFYLWFAWGRFHWSAYAAISGPLFVVAVLFLLGWRRHRRMDTAHA